MTEAEWIASTDPEPMLASLRGKLSSRKLRLFACACCRRIWHLLGDERSRSAVEVAERHADGLADGRQLSEAHALAEAAFHAIPWESSGMAGAFKLAASAAWGAADPNPEKPEFGIVFKMEPVAGFAMNAALQAGDAAVDRASERSAQARLLRDILGTPFRRVPVEPVWGNSTIRALAESIYQDQAFDRLPILANLLEDAGCKDGELIAHCRRSGPHVRGCWVVDLVLGKG